jgi:hypothetical protein
MAVVLLALASVASAQDLLNDYEQIEAVPGLNAPDPSASEFSVEQVEQGRYLVDLLGCGSCHTDGTLAGKPNAALLLAGSSVGIATSSPLENSKPGVIYPSNLTPDPETGIGDWNLTQIVTLLQSGTNNHGEQTLPVMPWLTYSRLRLEDATAIAMYLKSIPPVKHRVPANVRPGKKATAPFVYFGIYQSKD